MKTPARTTKAPAKPAAAAKAPRAKQAGTPKPAKEAKAEAPAAVTSDLRKKLLVERVAETTGVKRATVRSVVEAALEEIGAALSRGDGLNLAPLGKARVNRQKEKGSGEVIVIKLRRGKGGGDEGLADIEE